MTALAPAWAQQAYTPASDDTVLEQRLRPSGSANDAPAVLRQSQRALAADPRNPDKAVAFARQAISLGNEEGDPRYFGYAESALSPWWNEPKPAAEIRLARATILQWRHDFDGARRDLDSVIADDDHGVNQAHLTRAIVLMVQGEPAAARHDCAALIDHTDLLTAATCLASSGSLQAQAPAMERALLTILPQAANAPAATRLWAQTELAEIAVRLGHDALAGEQYEAALTTMQSGGHRDPYLLASYSDFLLDHQQAPRVLALLDGLDRIDNLLLRLARANAALADAGDAQARTRADAQTQQLQQRFNETRARGDFVHQREEAMYWLYLRHDAPHALTVAVDNWRKQRETSDARVLLEAAVATHDAAAAQPVLDWLKRTGLQDLRLQALASALSTRTSSTPSSAP